MYGDGKLFGTVAYEMVKEIVNALGSAQHEQPEREAETEAVQGEAKHNLMRSLRGLLERGKEAQAGVCAPATFNGSALEAVSCEPK